MRPIQTRSPDNIRIDNRQAEHKIIWNGEPWRFLRALFLSRTETSLCSWCSNIASVIAHPGDFRYDSPLWAYRDFHQAGCYPMCVPCNGAERVGKVLCPRCKRQHHYCLPGDVCWSCRPEAEREHLIYGKEHRQREKNLYDQKRRRKFHPKKIVKDGKWVIVDGLQKG